MTVRFGPMLRALQPIIPQQALQYPLVRTARYTRISSILSCVGKWTLVGGSLALVEVLVVLAAVYMSFRVLLCRRKGWCQCQTRRTSGATCTQQLPCVSGPHRELGYVDTELFPPVQTPCFQGATTEPVEPVQGVGVRFIYPASLEPSLMPSPKGSRAYPA